MHELLLVQPAEGGHDGGVRNLLVEALHYFASTAFAAGPEYLHDPGLQWPRDGSQDRVVQGRLVRRRGHRLPSQRAENSCGTWKKGAVGFFRPRPDENHDSSLRTAASMRPL